MSTEDYYTMLVCESGHVLTDRLECTLDDSKFCDECGARTIFFCPSCGAKIRGDRIDSGFVCIGHCSTAPKYCPECGNPFPWMVATIDALRELAELDEGLNETDRETLINSTETAMTENPKTKVAALKLKQVLSKAGKATASAARDLLIEVLAESAKKLIWS